MFHKTGGRPVHSSVSALHDSQRKLSAKATPQEIESANHEAMKAAIEASLNGHGGLTAFQKFALETGDPALIQQADDEALAIGIERSLDHRHDVPKSARASVPAEELQAQHNRVNKLKQWMTQLGFVIKPNHGNQNNCLIISMLQHATGNYDSNHESQARVFKQKLVGWSGGKEKTSSALYSDDDLFRTLVDDINQHYFKERKERYLRFKIVTPDLDGKPSVREVGDGPRVAGIIDGAGHYEAYVKSIDNP